MDRIATAALAALALGGCWSFGGCATAEDPATLETRLRALEERLVAEGRDRLRGVEPGDFAALVAAELGSDPYRIEALPEPDRYVVLLRNRSEIVLIDGRGTVLDRHSTPRSPAAWDRVDAGAGLLVFVAGELSPRLTLFAVRPDGITVRWETELARVGSIRDLAWTAGVDGSDRLFLIDAFYRRLLRIDLPDGWRDGATGSASRPTATVGWQAPVGAGPVEVRAVPGYLVVNELFDHSLWLLPLAGDEPAVDDAVRIRHLGPIWSFDVLAREDHLLVAAGGVENLPLDRTGGEFGYVDSYLYLYRLGRDPETGRIASGGDGGVASPVASDNLSARGVVTPKAVALRDDGDGATRLWVTGYGGEAAARYRTDGDRLQLAEVLDVPPGTTDLLVDDEILRLANPLLDGIVTILPDGEQRFARLDPDGGADAADGIAPGADQASTSAGPSPGTGTAARTVTSRLGEVLFFTTAMSPANRTEGELSRFTCETCHFEGSIDGRTHFTGRGHVFATTKPLRGLADNVPLFSRAGDEDLSSMIMAEFRVANQDRRAFFDLEFADHPWLRQLGDLPATLGPWLQRRALLEFLVDFRHRPQPLRAQGQELNETARRGLEVFRRRCEHCHQAVTSTRPDGRAIDPEEWPAWLQREGRDLLWGAPFFSKTGIEPYVDDAGARVPSLRRVVLKHPYFTNGSADDLRTVLERYRYRELSGWHEPPPDRPGATALSAGEIEALLALLQFF